jgi:hypothetical protein
VVLILAAGALRWYLKLTGEATSEDSDEWDERLTEDQNGIIALHTKGYPRGFLVERDVSTPFITFPCRSSNVSSYLSTKELLHGTLAEGKARYG